MPVNHKFPKCIHLYDMKGRGEGDRRKKEEEREEGDMREEKKWKEKKHCY